MNMYQINETATGEAITGAMSFEAAQRHMQTNRLSRHEYSIELHMPVKRETKETTAKYSVTVHNEENKVVAAFGCKNVATVAPGNMMAQYPALGKFLDSFIIGRSDVYEYEHGKIVVRES